MPYLTDILNLTISKISNVKDTILNVMNREWYIYNFIYTYIYLIWKTFIY